MYAICGASGKTGRAVIETLHSLGRSVRAVARAGKGVALAASGAEEVVEARLEDPVSLTRALDGVEGAYLLLPEDPFAPDVDAQRAGMADAMVAAVERARVPHVVFLSAFAAALTEGNGLGRHLRHAEQRLRGTPAVTTVLRAAYFLENVRDVAPIARQRGVYPSFFPIDRAMAMVSARDAGALAARLLVEPRPGGGVVDIMGPSYTAHDVAAALGVRPVEIPPPARVDFLAQAGLPLPFAALVVETLAAYARVAPAGDRLERGATTLAQVLEGTC